jgi:plastocyanin
MKLKLNTILILMAGVLTIILVALVVTILARRQSGTTGKSGGPTALEKTTDTATTDRPASMTAGGPPAAGTVISTGGTPQPPDPRTSTPRTEQVELRYNGIYPEALTVPAGSTIRWVNSGNPPLTVLLSDGTRLGEVKGDTPLEKVFSSPGTYSYTVTGGPRMKGEIVIIP